MPFLGVIEFDLTCEHGGEKGPVGLQDESANVGDEGKQEQYRGQVVDHCAPEDNPIRYSHADQIVGELEEP